MAIHLSYRNIVRHLHDAKTRLMYNERVLHVFGWEHSSSDLQEALEYIDKALSILYDFKDGKVQIKKPEEVG